MFERRVEPLASTSVFRARVLRFLLIAIGLTILWLGVGMLGFHFIGALSWRDALYNSAMMVSTMGPVYSFTSTPAMIFAAFYALGSGLAFLSVVGIASAPFIHRFFHIFHLDTNDSDNPPASS